MNIKLRYLILILIISFTSGFSQTKTDTQKNNLEFSTGYTIGALKNLEIAPVSRYDYNGLIYKLSYQRSTKKEKIVGIRLDYLQSELKTGLIPALNLDYSKVGLNISYLKKVYVKNNFSLHLGLHSQSNISIYSKDNNYRSIVDQKISLASQFLYQINERQRLSSQLVIPTVLFRATHASSGIYSLHNYQSILFNLRYGYSLSNRFDTTLSYDFNYDRLQISNAFRELQYQLSIGLTFKF